MDKFKYKEASTEVLQVKMPKSMKEDLKVLAESKGIKMGSYIKLLIEEELNKEFANAKEIVQKIVNHEK